MTHSESLTYCDPTDGQGRDSISTAAATYCGHRRPAATVAAYIVEDRRAIAGLPRLTDAERNEYSRRAGSDGWALDEARALSNIRTASSENALPVETTVDDLDDLAFLAGSPDDAPAWL